MWFWEGPECDWILTGHSDAQKAFSLEGFLVYGREPGLCLRDLSSKREGSDDQGNMTAEAITVVHNPFLSPSADWVMLKVRTIFPDIL